MDFPLNPTSQIVLRCNPPPPPIVSEYAGSGNVMHNRGPGWGLTEYELRAIFVIE